jgi:photosystem II PsbZ protein
MSVIFSIALLALVLLSFVLAVGVPVAYASGQDWDRSRQLLWVGSIAWVALVFAVGFLNSFVV